MGHFNPSNTMDGILIRVTNGRDSHRGIRISPYEPDLTLGTAIECPRCRETVMLVEYVSSYGKAIRYWCECSCLGVAAGRSAVLSTAAGAYQAQARTGHAHVNRALAAFTLDGFDPTRLDGGEKLVRAARRWLDLIGPLPVAPSYHDDPRCCLYFHSARKGCGKTHLACGLLNAASANDRHTAFADEIAYIEGYWGASLEQKAQLSAEPGEKAWLTILDDLGQRESTGPGLRDAWYDVINPRWLKRGWTVITSNWTPDELLSRGTINEATYSRIVQMTRGQLVTFHGSDQRLPQHNQKASEL